MLPKSKKVIEFLRKLKMNEKFLNNIFELISNKERLEDMGKNSLIASGYAQQRADEASIHLLGLLKQNNKKNVV